MLIGMGMYVPENVKRFAKHRGLKVVPATKSLTAEVTRADVSLAKKNSSKFCVWANALHRTGEFDVIRVAKNTTWLRRYNSKKLVKYVHSKDLVVQINRFDNYDARFVLGHYRILPPPPSRRPGVKKARGQHTGQGRRITLTRREVALA